MKIASKIKIPMRVLLVVREPVIQLDTVIGPNGSFRFDLQVSEKPLLLFLTWWAEDTERFLFMTWDPLEVLAPT